MQGSFLCVFPRCFCTDGSVIVEQIPLLGSWTYYLFCLRALQHGVICHRCCSDNYQRFICVGCSSWSSNCDRVCLAFDSCDIVTVKEKGKLSPYSITERRVPEMIPVLGSQPAGDVSHKPGGRLPLLSTRHALCSYLTTLKRAATSFAAWWPEPRWIWTVCLKLLPYSVAAAIWTRALLHLSPACWPLGYRATPLLGSCSFICQYRSQKRF